MKDKSSFFTVGGMLLFFSSLAAILVALSISPAKPASRSISIDRTFNVQPGTVLSVTQNGALLYAKEVPPGMVHVRIEYLR